MPGAFVAALGATFCEQRSIFNLRQSFEEHHDHLEMNTMRFIKAWLVEHIIQNDYLFRDYLARRKAPADATAP